MSVDVKRLRRTAGAAALIGTGLWLISVLWLGLAHVVVPGTWLSWWLGSVASVMVYQALPLLGAVLVAFWVVVTVWVGSAVRLDAITGTVSGELVETEALPLGRSVVTDDAAH